MQVLDEVDSALQVCSQHLGNTKSRRTSIESFLVLAFLVYMCREYDLEIWRALKQRAQRSGDVDLASFVIQSVKSHRHLSLDDLRRNILGRFSRECVGVFDSKVSQKHKIGYANIMRNRNTVAHQGPVSTTFQELELHHADARRILTAFAEALDWDRGRMQTSNHSLLPGTGSNSATT